MGTPLQKGALFVYRLGKMEKGYGNRYFVFLMLFLGLMSAFGPFITDMYLPSLPAMSVIFNASASAVQSGISTALIGLAVGQIFFGPISDRYGRRPVMAVSLLLFSVATVAAIFSPSIGVFNVMRFFQGIGGAGCIVLSRSVATDCYSGRDLVKIMTLIGAVNGVAPVTAPVIGGFVSELAGWQGVFWTLLAIAGVLLMMTLLFRESLVAEKRFKGSYKGLFGQFGTMLRDTVFMRYVLLYALSMSVLFSYISSASFIVQDRYGYGEIAFAVIFGINAFGTMIGSFVALKFPTLESATFTGAVLLTLASVGLLFNAFLMESFWIYESCTWIAITGCGFVFPSSTTLAMNAGRKAIGASSAIVGASGFIAGGIVSPLTGAGDMLLTSAFIMLVCSVLSWGLSRRL